jgi:hypothetical protein
MAMGKTEKINGYNRNDEQELLLNIAVEYFELDREQLKKFCEDIQEVLPDWGYLIGEDLDRDQQRERIIKENRATIGQALKDGISITIVGGKTFTLTSEKEVIQYLTATGKIRQEYISQRGNKSSECVNQYKAGIVVRAFCYINTHCNKPLSKNDKYYFAGIILALFGQLKPPDNFNHEGYVSNDSYRMYLHKRAERCIKSIKDTRITDEDIEKRVERMRDHAPMEAMSQLFKNWFKPSLSDKLYYYPGLDKKQFNYVLPHSINSPLFNLSVFNEEIVISTITELWGNH